MYIADTNNHVIRIADLQSKKVETLAFQKLEKLRPRRPGRERFSGETLALPAQVIDTEGVPIPGLFAAGEMVGGIFYFNYPGGTGLMNGAVFGRIAGASAGRVACGGGA